MWLPNMESLSTTGNPFSAAAVSGGRLPYFFGDPTAEKNLLQLLDRRQWIGQIVGPHGSGKTTLTHHLWRHAQNQFPAMVQVTIRGPKTIQRRFTGGAGARLVVIDGIERLSYIDRWLFLGGFSSSRYQQSRRVGQRDGLLVTGHRDLPWLPKVFETTFDEATLNRLAKELLPAAIGTGIHDGDGDVFSGQQWTDFSRALLQRHVSNGREILMEMYDRYEAIIGEKRLTKKRCHLQKLPCKTKLMFGGFAE